MKGVWLASTGALLIYGLSVILITEEFWFAQLPFLLFFSGPGSALHGTMDGLMGKLMPPELQATWRTGKNFLFDFQNAFLPLVLWQGLFDVSQDLAYPFDALPVMVAVGIGAVALALTSYIILYMDPQADITEGRVLEAFYASPYAQGPWYQFHTKGTWKTPQPPDADAPIPRGAASCPVIGTSERTPGRRRCRSEPLSFPSGALQDERTPAQKQLDPEVYGRRSEGGASPGTGSR